MVKALHVTHSMVLFLYTPLYIMFACRHSIQCIKTVSILTRYMIGLPIFMCYKKICVLIPMGYVLHYVKTREYTMYLSWRFLNT